MSENPDADGLSPCPYCGRLTSAQANFCYYCARELVARPEHPAEGPKPFKVNWLIWGLVSVMVVAGLVYLLVR